MLKNVFSNSSKTITGAALVLSGATLLSRVVGIVRDRIFTHYFSASSVTDAYFTAFKIPDLIYNLLIVGALTAGFIPVFTRLLHESKSKAWDLANNIVTIVAVFMTALCALGSIFAPQLLKLLAFQFPPETATLTMQLTRIMFLSPLLFGISMVMGGMLQSMRQFLLYSIAPIFYNIGIIFGAVVLVPIMGYTGLAWGVVLGAATHCLIQVAGAYHQGYRWHWRLSFKDPDTRQIGILMIPRTLGLAITQLNALILTYFASFLVVGSISVYYYANSLHTVPSGLIGIPFAVAAFPFLSSLHAEKDHAGFRDQLTTTMRKILFLIVPATIGIVLLRAQIVRLVYGSGAFDWTATRATFDTLGFFAIGLWAQSLIPLFARAYYALSNTRTPFIISVVAEVITIILAWNLMQKLGVQGLALATSLGGMVNCLLLIIWLPRPDHATLFSITEQVPFLWRIAFAGLGMGFFLQITKHFLGSLLSLNYFVTVLLQAGISGILALFIYGLICHFFAIAEMKNLQESLHKKWLRFRHIPGSINEAETLQ